MKDGIIRGDGTSRLLRANLPATYDELRAQAAAGTQPLDVLFNSAGWTQQPTFLNKANLLKDATAALFGLGSGATPDEVLAMFGMYRWERTKHNYQTFYEDAGTVILCSSTVRGDSNRTISYSDSVAISDNGELSLVNPSTIAVTMDSPGGTTLAGKYFKISTTFYYADTDATANTRIEGSYYQVYLKGTVKVVSVYDTPTHDIVYSADRNAYPDNGIENGCEYTYWGRLIETTMETAVRIETGSYVGTGVANTTIPLSFTPEFVFVFQRINDQSAFAIATETYNAYASNSYSGWALDGNSYGNVKVTTNGFMVGTYYSAWFNIASSTGYYIAIG